MYSADRRWLIGLLGADNCGANLGRLSSVDDDTNALRHVTLMMLSVFILSFPSYLS